MPWAPDYITLAELKGVLDITDTDDDFALQAAISAASRAVDHATSRQFGQEDAPVERFYRVPCDRPIRTLFTDIDDLMTTTGLLVDLDEAGDGTFTQSLTLDADFRLSPPNAALNGFPWTMIDFAPGLSLPRGTDFPDVAMRVTAQFGWNAVPDPVVEATLIQAERFFKRKDAPFGVAGSPEAGSEMRLLRRLDPDVRDLVATVRRYWAVM